MEHFAQGIVAGFAVSATIPAMYYFNKAALATLFAVNKAIGKAIARVIIPPEHTSINQSINQSLFKHGKIQQELKIKNNLTILNKTCNDDDDDCTIDCCSCGHDPRSC